MIGFYPTLCQLFTNTMENIDTIDELQRDIAEIMHSWYGDSKPCCME